VQLQTVPPVGYTAADEQLLIAMESIELAARDLYRAAVDAGAEGDVYIALGDNHAAYVDLLAGLLGRTAMGLRDDAFYEEQLSAFERTGTELAEAAYELESTLVVTYVDLLGQLEGVDGARGAASILMVEARHCAVLADVAGVDDFTALFDNDAQPIDVAAKASG
jgi:hypothetical protein